MKRKRLFRKAGDRLRGQNGDSIAEVLIALLISSLALVMLASMISSATRMITGSKSKLNEYYEAANAVSTFTETTEGGSSNKASSNVVISFPGVDSDSPLHADSGFSTAVDFYKNAVFRNREVISFRKQATPGGT